MLFNKNGIEYIIVGLGNPGIRYEQTRHNVGFTAADFLSGKFNATFKLKNNALYATVGIGKYKCLVLKPQTYMNNSGEAVAYFANYYKIAPEKIIVICDDVSLPFGSLRIKRKGSFGGHNGIKSIIELLGSDDFVRIKIGVGNKPNPDYDLADFVLGKFSKDESARIKPVIENAAEAAQCIITEDIDTAMNRYNKISNA